MRATSFLLVGTFLSAGCSSSAEAIADRDAASSRASVASGGATAVAVLREEKPGLLARAKITETQARSLALARVPGGRVVDAELEEEDGRLVYSFDLELGGEPGTIDVEIDAMTGEVLSVELEDEEDTEDDDADPDEQENER